METMETMEKMNKEIEVAQRKAYDTLLCNFLKEKEYIKNNYLKGLITVLEYAIQDKTHTENFIRALENNNLKHLANYE